MAYRAYDDDFRKEIARRHFVDGKSYRQLSDEYDISLISIQRWSRQYKNSFVSGDKKKTENALLMKLLSGGRGMSNDEAINEIRNMDISDTAALKSVLDRVRDDAVKKFIEKDRQSLQTLDRFRQNASKNRKQKAREQDIKQRVRELSGTPGYDAYTRKANVSGRMMIYDGKWLADDFTFRQGTNTMPVKKGDPLVVRASYGRHVFTDAELDLLFAGKEISFEENDNTITGALGYQLQYGKLNFGFMPGIRPAVEDGTEAEAPDFFIDEPEPNGKGAYSFLDDIQDSDKDITDDD